MSKPSLVLRIARQRRRGSATLWMVIWLPCLLALFVTDGVCGTDVHVVEYVAEKDTFEKELSDVRAAVQTYAP